MKVDIFHKLLAWPEYVNTAKCRIMKQEHDVGFNAHENRSNSTFYLNAGPVCASHCPTTPAMPVLLGPTTLWIKKIAHIHVVVWLNVSAPAPDQCSRSFLYLDPMSFLMQNSVCVMFELQGRVILNKAEVPLLFLCFWSVLMEGADAGLHQVAWEVNGAVSKVRPPRLFIYKDCSFVFCWFFCVRLE